MQKNRLIIILSIVVFVLMAATMILAQLAFTLDSNEPAGKRPVPHRAAP